jgi:predicted nucleic acid-binding protein
MSGDRLLLDTVFIQALLNRNDQYHSAARRLVDRVAAADEVWVTEAVLIEVANALSALNREGAAHFIALCYETANVRVVSVGTPLLRSALALYRARADKEWGLTDCISMVVMREQGLREVVTADRHFVQAGFRASLRA